MSSEHEPDLELKAELNRLAMFPASSGTWTDVEARARKKGWKPGEQWSMTARVGKRVRDQRQSSGSKPSAFRRRSGLRVAVYACIAVVLAAGAAIGSLEAVRHLGKGQPIIVITDDTLGPAATGQTTGQPASSGAQAGQWEPVPLISEGGNVSALAMDPTDPAVLYAGTDQGVFKSTDGAESWKKLEGIERWVFLIAVDPGSPSTVYAGGGYTDSYLYRSDDGGASWTELTEAPSRLEVYPIGVSLFDPTTSPSTIYLWCEDSTLDSTGSHTYVSRSTDRGETWTRLSLGQEPDTLVDPRDVGKTAFSGPVTDADTGILLEPTTLLQDPATGVYYAGTSDGVYKSTDLGKTWKKASAGLTSSGASGIVPNPASGAVPDPGSESILYAVTSAGIIRTTDSGETWDVSLRAPGSPDEKSLVIAPSSPSTLYALTSAGLFRTDDGGQSWSRKAAEGLPRPLPPETEDVIDGLVLVSPGDPNKVFALVLAGGEEGSQSPGTRYLWRSTDGGDTWSRVYGGDGSVPTGGYELLYSAVAVQADPSVMYAWRDPAGLLKSTDSGATWTVISPELWVGRGYLWPDAVAVDAGTPSTVYVVVTTKVPLGGDSYKDAILRSSDGGTTWEEVGAPVQIISGLWLDPQSPDTLYVVESGPTTGQASLKGLYRSTDRGATWQNISGDLAQDLSRDAGSCTLVTGPGGALYALTDAGLYRWVPGGE